MHPALRLRSALQQVQEKALRHFLGVIRENMFRNKIPETPEPGCLCNGMKALPQASCCQKLLLARAVAKRKTR
jgi:hypothetical protein